MMLVRMSRSLGCRHRPLHHSVMSANPSAEVIKALLAGGADAQLAARANPPGTALHMATSKGLSADIVHFQVPTPNAILRAQQRTLTARPWPPCACVVQMEVLRAATPPATPSPRAAASGGTNTAHCLAMCSKVGAERSKGWCKCRACAFAKSRLPEGAPCK